MGYEYRDLVTGYGLTESQLYERYDWMLDEVGTPDAGPVRIGTLEYPASVVLKRVDPIAYQVGYSEWLDSEIGETIEEVSA